LQVLAGRPLELFKVFHIIIVGIDDELRQRARLASRRTSERCSVGERNRLWFLFVGPLHHKLLGWWLRASAKNRSDNKTENAEYLSVHLIASLLFRHAVLAHVVPFPQNSDDRTTCFVFSGRYGLDVAIGRG
jgi:hypothetical protein